MGSSTYTYVNDDVEVTEAWGDGTLTRITERKITQMNGSEGMEVITWVIQVCVRGLAIFRFHSHKVPEMMIWACGMETATNLLDIHGGNVVQLAMQDIKIRREAVDLVEFYTLPPTSRGALKKSHRNLQGHWFDP